LPKPSDIRSADARSLEISSTVIGATTPQGCHQEPRRTRWRGCSLVPIRREISVSACSPSIKHVPLHTIPLGGLDRDMNQQGLDLVKFATAFATELRASAPRVVQAGTTDGASSLHAGVSRPEIRKAIDLGRLWHQKITEFSARETDPAAMKLICEDCFGPGCNASRALVTIVSRIG